MKTYDYIVLSIMIIADAALFWLRGCELESVLFFAWLGVIAIFVILMKRIDDKKKMRREIRREIQRALTSLIK